MQNQLPTAPTHESGQPDTLQVFKKHLDKAKLWAYGSLLVIGGIQIILRERFPKIKPPWPWIAGALIVGLVGYIIVPPIICVMRTKKS